MITDRELLDRLASDLRLSGKAARTAEAYTGAVRRLARVCGKPVAEIGESEVRAWRLRLEQFDHDLASEPDRIRDFYQVRARRVEPVGLVYLWPETN